MKKASFPLLVVMFVFGLALVLAVPMGAASSIMIEKTEMNGLHEAHKGGTLQYEYLVSIPGGYESIHDVVVTDDAGTPGDPADDFHPSYISGDTNTNGILENGEEWLYRSAPYTITDDTPDPFRNNAKAEGKDPDELDVWANSWWIVDIVPVVGGDVHQISRIGVLAPWIGLALLLIGGVTWFTLRRRNA